MSMPREGLCFLKASRTRRFARFRCTADPYLRVAYAYVNKGDIPKAIENLERFIKLEPETERTAQAKAFLDAIRK